MKQTIITLSIAVVAFATVVSCKGDKSNTTSSSTAEVKTEVVDNTTVAEYTVDATQSFVTWLGSKPTGKHNGTVNVQSGTFKTKGTSITDGTFVIDMTSIKAEDLEGDSKASLEAHLMGTAEGKEGDFFNVKEYPTATFTITGINALEDKTFIQGVLDIKGVENKIEFPIATTVNEDTMTFNSKTFTIDRTKWDVNYGSKSVFDNLGDRWIDDDMELTVTIVAKKA